MIDVNSATFKQDIQYELAKLDITQRQMALDLGFTEPYLSNILSYLKSAKTMKYREEIVEYIERKKAILNEVIESRCVVNE